MGQRLYFSYFLFCAWQHYCTNLLSKKWLHFFYQNFVPEAILWACGHEFLFPKNTITELIPFLRGQVLSFDCKTLPPLDLYNITSDFAAAQPYLT